MRWLFKEEQATKPVSNWKPWFAWYPVIIKSHTLYGDEVKYTVWCERVLRKLTDSGWGGSDKYIYALWED